MASAIFHGGFLAVRHGPPFAIDNTGRLEDSDSAVSVPTKKSGMKKVKFNLKGLPFSGRGRKNASKSLKLGMLRGSDGLKTIGRSLRSGVTNAVFPEDLKVSEKGIFDPQSKSLMTYNRIFELICIFSVSVDPLFLYLPIFNHLSYCLAIDTQLAKAAVWIRSILDVLFVFRIALQFCTAFIAPSSRVFGRGEFVIDPAQIAKRYLMRYFIVDLVSVLPLPQAMVWKYFHKTKGSVLNTKQSLLKIVLIQFVPRFGRFIPLFSEMKKAAGSVSTNALIGAAYYLLWFLLCGHMKMMIQNEDDDTKALVAGTDSSSCTLGATMLASRFAANALRGHKQKTTGGLKLQKPREPDFDDYGD